MYNELMPYWKARCRGYELMPYWKARCREYGLAPELVPAWVGILGGKGIYHAPYAGARSDPEIGRFEWVRAEDGHYDCLVLGVMLFTWEEGIKP